MNIQSFNVGNIGDIIKHSALVELINIIEANNSCLNINYIDTHSYLAYSVCNDVKQWKYDIENLRKEFPLYNNYLQLESSFIEKNSYACSVGIAIEKIQRDKIKLYLAEIKENTRKKLLNQIQGKGLRPELLISNAEDFMTINFEGEKGDVVALFDPFFEHDADYLKMWNDASSFISKSLDARAQGVVLAFQFRKDDNPIWGDAPSGFTGPIATISKKGDKDKRYHLAVYSTNKILPRVKTTMRELGWNISQSKKEIMHIGIDLAWGASNKTGIAYWKSSWDKAQTELFTPVKNNKDETIYKLFNRIKEIIVDCENVIIAIDAPLMCPVDSIKREWENYIPSCGTTYETYINNISSGLVKTLSENGYADFLSDPFINRQKACEGSLGFKYVEVFPSPTIHAFAKEKIKYKSGKYNKLSLAELVDNLDRVIKCLENIQLPFKFAISADNITTESQRKMVEDQYDALVCLSVAVMLTDNNVVARNFSNKGGLYAVGGIKENIGQGAIVTPLIIEQTEVLPNDILHNLNLKPQLSIHPIVDLSKKNDKKEPTIEQQKIIKCDAPLVRVIARAGTGKTFTMIHRAKQILNTDPSANVLMMTFTRNAADEMTERFKELGGDAGRFEAGTFHGIALKRLLKFAKKVNVLENVSFNFQNATMLNEFGRDSVLNFIQKKYEDEIDFQKNWKENLSAGINKKDPLNTTPARLLSSAGNLEEIYFKVLELYSRENMIDFDIIMIMFEYLLRSDESFLAQSRNVIPLKSSNTTNRAISHIIVDEFQDTNYPQLRTVEHLSGFEKNPDFKQLMVVGDDMQTIYRWRGAVKNIFDEISTNLTQVETLPLSISQRSSKEIIDNVNLSVQRLKTREEHKNLASYVPDISAKDERQAGGRAWSNPEKNIVATIRDVVDREHLDYKDVTCLAYTNDKASELKCIIQEAGIPCDLLTAKPSEMIGVKKYLTFLSLLATPDLESFACLWDLSYDLHNVEAKQFETAWNYTKKGNREKKVSWIKDLLGDVGGNIFEQLNNNFDITKPNPNFFMDSIKTMEKILPEADTYACERVARIIVEKLSFEDDLLRITGEMTRKDFAGSEHVKNSCVQISTIHQYKGLENTVILLNYDFQLKDDEKYRLDYVARSRARKFLCAFDSPVQIHSDYELQEDDEKEIGVSMPDIKTKISIAGVEREVVLSTDGSIRNPETGFKINPQTGADILDGDVQKNIQQPVVPSQKVSSEATGRVSFLWNGETRDVLLDENDPIINSAPWKNGVRWLVKLTKDGGISGYSEFQRVIGVNSTLATFGPLGSIQIWCRKNGLFDLSALIVSNKSGVPGGGHYKSDTRNENEWREYVRLAVMAFKNTSNP